MYFKMLLDFRLKRSGQIKTLCPVEGKKPYTVVMFKLKKGKHVKKGKKSSLKRAANRVK